MPCFGVKLTFLQISIRIVRLLFLYFKSDSIGSYIFIVRDTNCKAINVN